MSRAFIQKRLPFKPTDIGGCQLWLDGADATTLTLSGSIVTQWRDKSGSGNNATPVYTGPTLVQNVKNSLPGLSFSGGNIMKCGAFLTSTSFSAFIVVNNNSGTKVSMGVWKVQYGSYIITDVEIKVGTENSSVYSNTSITIPNFTTTHMYAVTLSSSSAPGSSFTYNGSYDGLNTVITGTSSLGNAATCAQEVAIGGLMENNSPQYMMTGYIHEVIFFSNALTSTQRQQVESYLAQKWGLQTSLPQGHPGTRGIVYPSDPVNLLVRVPYPSAFVPTTAGNCQLWLDAADSTTLTGTSPVTQWRDKSGNARNTTTYAGTPALTTNAINSVQAINFNGGSSFTGSIPGSGTSYTLFFVGTFNNSTGTYGGFICFGRSGTPDHVSGITNTKLTDSSMYSTIDSTNTAFTSNTLSTPFVYSLVIDGTFLNNFVNGNQQSPANVAKSASFNFTNYVVGDRAGSTSSIFLNGYVGEIIVYINSLATLQRQQVEGYLAWKWGLQANLPANHPYKNASPNITNQFGISRPANVLPIPPITISARVRPTTYVTAGVLFYLDAGNATSYPGTGSTWTDLAGSGLTTTLFNTPTYSSANGGYLSFAPASSQYCQTSASLATQSVWSVEIWHYYTATNIGPFSCIITEVFGGGPINFAIGSTSGNTNTLEAGYYNNGWYSTTSSYSLPSVGWYQIVGTYDGTNLKLYVNNVLTQTQVSAGTPVSGGLGIRFMRRWDTGDYWGGRLAIIRIYNRALLASEVTTNYTASKARFGLS